MFTGADKGAGAGAALEVPARALGGAEELRGCKSEVEPRATLETLLVD